MHCMARLSPIMAVIPISFLLALSFFVWLSAEKVTTKKLKNFGFLVVTIIWLAVLVIILGAARKLVKGMDQKKCMMRQEMMMRSMPGMHPEKMPAVKGTK